MRTEDAVRHFGTKSAIARALGITKASLTSWGERVPALRAWQLSAITAGKLKFDPNEYLGRPAPVIPGRTAPSGSSRRSAECVGAPTRRASKKRVPPRP
jgi:hypothetical protein